MEAAIARMAMASPRRTDTLWNPFLARVQSGVIQQIGPGYLADSGAFLQPANGYGRGGEEPARE